MSSRHRIETIPGESAVTNPPLTAGGKFFLISTLPRAWRCECRRLGRLGELSPPWRSRTIAIRPVGRRRWFSGNGRKKKQVEEARA